MSLPTPEEYLSKETKRVWELALEMMPDMWRRQEDDLEITVAYLGLFVTLKGSYGRWYIHSINNSDWSLVAINNTISFPAFNPKPINDRISFLRNRVLLLTNK